MYTTASSYSGLRQQARCLAREIAIHMLLNLLLIKVLLLLRMKYSVLSSVKGFKADEGSQVRIYGVIPKGASFCLPKLF
jgi:hypothetical protein